MKRIALLGFFAFAVSCPAVAQSVASGGTVLTGPSILFAPAAAGGHTATLVQKASNTACTANSSTCAITVASTGTGDAIVVEVVMPGTNVTNVISSVSGGGTYTDCSACDFSQNDAISGSFQVASTFYTLNSSSGATTITVTLNSTPAGTAWAAFAYEYSTTGTFAFDTGGNTHDFTGTSNATYPGVALSLTGTQDLIVQAIGIGFGTAPNAINLSYADTVFSGNGSAADLLNTTNGTAPTWTLASSQCCMVGTAIAIKY